MIYLDCMPFVVNRTAMYKIIRDTVARLNDRSEFRLSLIERPIEALDEATEAPLIFRFALRRPKLAYILNFFILTFAKNKSVGLSRVVFFDPLYILFKKNIERDVVWVLDLTPYTVPKFHSPGVGFLYRRAFEKLRRSKCKIVAISESTSRDLRLNLGVDPSRIKVIPLYSALKENSSEQFRETVNLGESSCLQVALREKKFLLFVGSLEERKNLRSLIRAYKQSGLFLRGVHLVVAGGKGHGSVEILSEIARTNGVMWSGYVTDREMDWLYKNCSAFVYPSLWEGFGVPLLEAMSRGVLCVSTETGACPEIGGDFVEYCDPCDVKSIERALLKILELSQASDFETRKSRVIERSKEFNFEKYLNSLRSFVTEGLE